MKNLAGIYVRMSLHAIQFHSLIQTYLVLIIVAFYIQIKNRSKLTIKISYQKGANLKVLNIQKKLTPLTTSTKTTTTTKTSTVMTTNGSISVYNDGVYYARFSISFKRNGFPIFVE